MDAMKTLQLSYSINSVEQTGLELTCSSGDQKPFSIKGSKRFTLVLTERKETP
jgi:hypothetical protein